MRYLNSFLIFLALSGCATPLELPQWDTLPLASVEVQRPLETPPRPLAASSTGNTITYDEQGIRDLSAYVEIAEGNQVIAENNALALEAQARAYNHLLDAGEYQRQIAIIRQEQLNQERKNRFWDGVWYKGIIALGLIAIAL